MSRPAFQFFAPFKPQAGDIWMIDRMEAMGNGRLYGCTSCDALHPVESLYAEGRCYECAREYWEANGGAA